MPKMYIDTNKFVGFYQANHDSLVIFEELKEASPNLVTTEQTVNEFHRNRVSTLRWLIGKFRESTNFKPFTTSLMRAVPGHSDLLKMADSLKAPAKRVVDHLEALVKDEVEDPVAQGFAAIRGEKPFPLST